MGVVFNETESQSIDSLTQWVKVDPRAITVILYKFGGFYLDLDYVVFNDLTQFHNIVVGNRG